MDKIYLIMTERWTGEDTSGRDIHEFKYDPETDPGFFLSEDDARDWIIERRAEQHARYEQKMGEYRPKHEQYLRVMEAHAALQRATAAMAADAGLRPPLPNYIDPPVKPRLDNFVDTYRIAPVEREG